MDINLKAEFKDLVIGFNNSAAPLGERKDLDKLVAMAHRSGRQDYLDMFENPPSLEALQSEAADTRLEAIVKPYQAPAAYPTSPATPLAPVLTPPADTTPTREVETSDAGFELPVLPELPANPEVPVVIETPVVTEPVVAPVVETAPVTPAASKSDAKRAK